MFVQWPTTTFLQMGTMAGLDEDYGSSWGSREMRNEKEEMREQGNEREVRRSGPVREYDVARLVELWQELDRDSGFDYLWLVDHFVTGAGNSDGRGRPASGGLDGAGGACPGNGAHAARDPGHGQHVPPSGGAGEDGDNSGPHLERAAGVRARGRVASVRARGVRHTVSHRARAAGPAGRGGSPHQAAVDGTAAASSTGSTTS